MTEKLLAEWFWIDRWMGSSAFLLPMEARGLYREMLSQAWRRSAHLPNDHDAIRRAVGASAREWARSWPKVARYWRVDGDSLVSIEQFGFARALPGQTEQRRHIPLTIRALVLARDGRVCAFCGTDQALSVDHVVPYSRGGLDIPENLRILCMPCNRARGVVQ